MRDERRDDSSWLLVAGLLLLLSPYAMTGETMKTQKLCDMHKMDEVCDDNERCFQVYDNGPAVCACMLAYELVDGHCVPSGTTDSANATTAKLDTKDDSGGSSVAAGLLIPTFLIVIGVMLYFGARRYKWLQRIRQYRQTHYGDVLVTRDDDDDDEPIQ